MKTANKNNLNAIRNLVIFSFLVFASISCNFVGKPENFDYGRVENDVYLNNYFDLKIKLPSKWVVLSREQLDALVNRGKQIIAGDDKKKDALLKVSEINTAYLLGVFQYELGSAVESNPNIMIVAENVKLFPGIKSGSDYLYQSKKLLEQTPVGYDSISKEFVKETIDGTEFYKMNTYLSRGESHFKQIYYSTLVKGFSFTIIISYTTDEQEQILLKSIKSLSFKK